MRAGATVIALIACGLVAGCGGDEPADSPEDAVRATLTKLADGVRDKNYDALCTSVFAPDLVDGLEEVGLTCPKALAGGFDDVQSPQISVDAISVDGTTATARVRTSAIGQDASTDTVRLTKTGEGWRVSSLGGEAAPTPSPAP